MYVAGATLADPVNGPIGTPGYFGPDFLATGAVPEPATWAMMLLGFGGLGVAMPSRRRAALAV